MTRRQFLKLLSRISLGAAVLPWLPRWNFAAALEGTPDKAAPLRKVIPSTGEKIPVIGMGTWQTFNVGPNSGERDQRVEVLRRFFELGGGMIDSSPMYGLSEEALGYCLEQLDYPDGLFSASKIWSILAAAGTTQFNNSQRLWGVNQFDLFQVHNLLNVDAHLKTLRELKDKGLIRYVGLTTSHGRRHENLLQLMATEPMDFIQVTYNILDREVEDQILPLAAERGIAVIANRPFQGGRLFDRFQDDPLPEWAKEFDARNWAQFFLKFIVSHPAVTCAVPATTQVEHMTENMNAAFGRMPDQTIRRRMTDYMNSLL